MIRNATPKDFPAILKMSEHFWNSSTQFHEPASPDHIMLQIENCYYNGYLIVAEIDGEVVGFISAISAPLLGTDKAWTCTETGFWINPESRGTMLAPKLIRHLEHLCMQDRVKYLNLAFMETSMPDKVKKLYQSLGYTLQETVYTKVLYGRSDERGSSRGWDTGRCVGRPAGEERR